MVRVEQLWSLGFKCSVVDPDRKASPRFTRFTSYCCFILAVWVALSWLEGKNKTYALKRNLNCINEGVTSSFKYTSRSSFQKLELLLDSHSTEVTYTFVFHLRQHFFYHSLADW